LIINKNMNFDKIECNKRQNSFFKQLDLADSSIRRYRDALKSSFLTGLVMQEFRKDSIFYITDIEKLWKFYSMINLHPANIRMHRYYSAPLMKYISFLNGGKKYGRRIDFQKKREKRSL